MNELRKHSAEIRREVAAGRYEQTADGILLPRMGALASGRYKHRVNGGDWQEDHNLITTEGLNFMLNVAVGATAKVAGWYVGLFSGAITPQATWTAANFAATASEITSTTEGYAGTLRLAYNAGVAAAGNIDNSASRATFNIVCSTNLTVQGAAIVSSNVRGGTSGILLSAARYATPRVFANGDIFDCEYDLTLTAV